MFHLVRYFKSTCTIREAKNIMLQFFLGFLRGVIERGVHCRIVSFYEGFLTVFPSKYYFKCNILNITRLHRKEKGGSGLRPQRQWQWHQQPTAASARAGNGDQSRGSAMADNNQPKSGSNSSRNDADGGTETAAAMAVAATMATVAMAVTTRQPWQR
jgi:hypothetical protein